jgi:antitoxin PrlF
MALQSKITAKGQTTVPQEVREALGLKPGDRVDYVIREGRVEMLARNLRAADMAGLLGRPPSGVTLNLSEIEDAIAEAAVSNDQRVGNASPKP